MYMFKSPLIFSLIYNTFFAFGNFCCFNPCALVPFFVLFLFLFSLENGVKEIEPYEGLYIKEGLFCANSLLEGWVSKNKPNCNWCSSTRWFYMQHDYFVLWFLIKHLLLGNNIGGLNVFVSSRMQRIYLLSND